MLNSGNLMLHMDCIKRIWYLPPMRAAKVQASLRIYSVSQEPPLLAHTSSELRGTFRQKARSLASLNGWACAVKTCHDGMLEDTNLLDRAHMMVYVSTYKINNRNGLRYLPNVGAIQCVTQMIHCTTDFVSRQCYILLLMLSICYIAVWLELLFT